MAKENQLSRYGQFGRAIFVNNPRTGAASPISPAAKYFFVGATSLPSYSDYLQEFGVDADGQNRTFATLQTALSDANIVSARGDVIFILPGHTETLTSAGAVAISKTGVAVIGLGLGGLKPTFTFSTSAAASFNVTGANTVLQNIRFTTAIDAQTAVLNVSANDVAVDSCEFIFSNGTVGALVCINTTATADRLRVTNCRFYGPAINAGSTLTAAIKHEAGVDYVIDGNIFVGKATQMIVNVATVLRGIIDDNRFVVGTGTVAITMAAGSTPMITNNRINVASGTTPIVAAAGFVAGNTYSAAAGVTAGVAVTF